MKTRRAAALALLIALAGLVPLYGPQLWRMATHQRVYLQSGRARLAGWEEKPFWGPASQSGTRLWYTRSGRRYFPDFPPFSTDREGWPTEKFPTEEPPEPDAPWVLEGVTLEAWWAAIPDDTKRIW